MVGESGCDKSTLFHLLTGCYKNYKGSLSVDGTEISGFVEKLTEGLHTVIMITHKTDAETLKRFDKVVQIG